MLMKLTPDADRFVNLFQIIQNDFDNISMFAQSKY